MLASLDSLPARHIKMHYLYAWADVCFNAWSMRLLMTCPTLCLGIAGE